MTERFRAANFLGRANHAAHGTHRAMINPFEFIQQVRVEATKVVWPTRRETLITTGLVMLMAVFASVFFILVDEALRVLVSLVLGFGRGG